MVVVERGEVLSVFDQGVVTFFRRGGVLNLFGRGVVVCTSGEKEYSSSKSSSSESSSSSVSDLHI